MIRQCFTIFKGIGPKREKALHESGIVDWAGLLGAARIPGVKSEHADVLRCDAERWQRALAAGDADFFAENLAQGEHWRLFQAFRNSIRYLDIETTGLSPHSSEVTVVGVHDGTTFTALINGKNLSAGTLTEALDGGKLIVSFYGAGFDVPFLQTKYPSVNWKRPHFDLCFGGRRVGLRGGLKRIERELGLVRGDNIADVDGLEAVRLWHAYKRGNAKALKTLVEYNEADTANLAVLAPIIHQRLCETCGTASP